MEPNTKLTNKSNLNRKPASVKIGKQSNNFVKSVRGRLYSSLWWEGFVEKVRFKREMKAGRSDGW